MTGFVTLVCSLNTRAQADHSHRTLSFVVSRRLRHILHRPARHTFAPPMVTNATNPTHCALLSEIFLRRNLKHWHLYDRSQHRRS